MKSIVLCFFVIASLAVNLVELYEYNSNTNYEGPDANMVAKKLSRRSAPNYLKPEEVKKSVTNDKQQEAQRNKRHIPGYPIFSAQYYPHAAQIATYPVAQVAPLAQVAHVAPVAQVAHVAHVAPVAAPVPMLEEPSYMPAYHYSHYEGPYGAHAVL